MSMRLAMSAMMLCDQMALTGTTFITDEQPFFRRKDFSPLLFLLVWISVFCHYKAFERIRPVFVILVENTGDISMDITEGKLC